MRILAISDIHSSFSKLKRLFEIEHAEFLAVCGDVTDFVYEDVKTFKKIVENFEGICLVVHGNCDFERAFHDIDDERLIFMHGKSFAYNEVVFHGLGGSTYTPFNTPSEYSESFYYSLLKNFRYGKRNVLVSHSPPHGILDRTHYGKRAGSIALKEYLHKFDYVLCGHIHEARGVVKQGRTTIVNSGAFKRGYYSMVDLNGGVRLLKI